MNLIDSRQRVNQPKLVSLHTGQPLDYCDENGATWRTALVKAECDGPLQICPTGPVGDAVADTRHHGGLHQAVMVYSRVHRAYWLERFGLDITPGGLGENFSVEGICDETACIGDVYQVGSAILQVSQPRQPCNTLARYWRCPDLLPAIWETARSGWYFRVMKEGSVCSGEIMILQQRPHPGWSVARVLRALRDANLSPDEALEASTLEYITPTWQSKLREKISG